MNNFKPILLALLVGLPGIRTCQANDPWRAWQSGDIETAAALAANIDNLSERSHLLFLCRFVKGQYESALEKYNGIDSSYSRYAELDGPVIDCYLHLSRYDQAASFASSRKTGPVEALRLRAARPLRASLDKLTVIPFADHELTQFFPAFAVEIEGQSATAHLDTGGSFIAMSPDHAKRFGIELIDYGQGFHGHRRVELQFGIATKFRLGEAVLENVPVIVFPTNKHVILGTCILQQYLSTLDYPGNRLILSPKSDTGLHTQHLGMLLQPRVEVPFFMWGDHYMFARGWIGDHRHLNFFMDSGLVALRKINDQPMIQAGFTSSRERYLEWGFEQHDFEQNFFQSHLPIGIGPLRQDAIWFLAGPGGEAHGNRTFGGVQMHGVLAHAFVKRYSWTLDFQNHKYIFGRAN